MPSLKSFAIFAAKVIAVMVLATYARKNVTAVDDFLTKLGI